MLLTILVHALIFCSIRPLLDALPVLLVLEPITDICGSISMDIGSVPVSLIVEPLSLVDVAVSVDQLTMSIGLVTVPVPVVFATVLP